MATYLGLYPQQVSDNSAGPTIDMVTSSGAMSASQMVGVVSGGSATLTGKIQESDNGSSWSDVSGGAFTSVAASTNLQTISFTRTKRYVRYSRTITGVGPSAWTSVIIQG